MCVIVALQRLRPWRSKKRRMMYVLLSQNGDHAEVKGPLNARVGPSNARVLCIIQRAAYTSTHTGLKQMNCTTGLFHTSATELPRRNPHTHSIPRHPLRHTTLLIARRLPTTWKHWPSAVATPYKPAREWYLGCWKPVQTDSCGYHHTAWVPGHSARRGSLYPPRC